MNVRQKFIEAREKPLREKATQRVEQFLGALVLKLPGQMQAEIDKAGQGRLAGSIHEIVYPDYEGMTTQDVTRLPSFAALHKLCADPDVDVCVTMTETPPSTERGYESGKGFNFTLKLDKPYSASNYKPSDVAARKQRKAAP